MSPLARLPPSPIPPTVSADGVLLLCEPDRCAAVRADAASPSAARPVRLPFAASAWVAGTAPNARALYAIGRPTDAAAQAPVLLRAEWTEAGL